MSIMSLRLAATVLFTAAPPALAVGAQGSAIPAAAHPKHLVMIVIDDLGFDDMGYANGGQISTPNFNEMHARGIALTQYDCDDLYLRIRLAAFVDFAERRQVLRPAELQPNSRDPAHWSEARAYWN